MNQTLTIIGSLPKLNEHDNMNRRNRFMGAALKKKATELVASQCSTLEPITSPINLTFHWYISGKHDHDNVRFAVKYILDGIVHSGKLPNDNPTWVRDFGGDSFHMVSKGDEKIIVDIEEIINP